MAEIGLIQGLAYRHNFQADMQNALQLKGIERQYAQDARIRNKLILDEINFGVATNAWDRKLLETATDKQMAVIGELIVDAGGDVTSDLSKYIEYKKETSKLLNFPSIFRAGRIEEHRVAMIEDLRDPKMSMYKDDIEEQMEAYARYVDPDTGGSMTENPEDKVEFVYSRPGSELNITDIIIDIAKNITKKGTRNEGFSTTRYVRQIEIQDAAKTAAIGDGPIAKKIQSTWESMTKEQKNDFPNGISQWLASSFTPHVEKDTDRVNRGAILAAGSTGRDQANKQFGLLQEAYANSKRFMNAPYAITSGSSRAMYTDKEGNFSTSNLVMFSPISNEAKYVNFHVTPKLSFPDSHIITIGDKNDPTSLRTFVSATGTMPFDDLEEVYGQNVYDHEGWFDQIFNFGDQETREKFQGGKPNFNEFKVVDGQAVFTVWKEIDPTNTQIIADFNSKSGVGTKSINLSPQYYDPNINTVNEVNEADEDGNVWRPVIK